MDSWQRDHIIRSKDKLINLTVCNGEFLSMLESSGVLAPNEIKKLRAIGFSSGDVEQSAQMYDFVITRTSGYEKLTSALFQTKQSGSFKILMEGFENNGVLNPFSKCGITPDVTKFLAISTLLRDRAYPMSVFCKGVDSSTIASILQNTLSYQVYSEIFANNETAPTFIILNNTIPEPPQYYIPRQLTAKTHIDPKMFTQSDCTDVYIFMGIARHRLSETVAPFLTDVSGNQTNGITVRHILLEDEGDLDSILNIASTSIQLIRYDTIDNAYNLEAMWGGSLNISKHLLEKSITLSEEDFIAVTRDLRAPVVCICDSPGMGKSVLLANLAKRMSEEYLDNIVAFIPLLLFMNTLPGKVSDISHQQFNPLKLIVEYISPTNLSQEILMEIMTIGKRPVELFLDGFDELSEKASDFVQYYISYIVKKYKHFRIYITSRCHKQNMLEDRFGVLSYNILPFDERCQKMFLFKFWKQEYDNADHARLKQFAKFSLRRLKAMNSCERDIAGIPLQCYLLAQVYSKEADKYSKPTSTVPLINDNSWAATVSIFEMYNEFLNKMFNREVDEADRGFVRRFHTLCALKILFPEIVADYEQLAQLGDKKISLDKLLSYGILEKSRSYSSQVIIKFTHLTFAEFTVATFFADLIYGKFFHAQEERDLYKRIIHFVLHAILETYECEQFDSPISGLYQPRFASYRSAYPVIMYFVSAQMKNKNFLSLDLCVLDMFDTILEPDSLYQLWHACAQDQHTEFLSFIKEAIRCISERKGNQFNKDYFLDESRWHFLLLVATTYASKRFVETCLEIYEIIYQCDFSRLFSEIPKNMLTPLHVAAGRGNYGIVEVLLNYHKHSFPMIGLVHACVAETSQNSAETLAEKHSIIKLLASKSKECIKEIWYGYPPLLAHNLHMDIIKLLLELGADINANNHEGDNLAHKAMKYLSSAQYHELVKFLQQNKYNDLFVLPNMKGRTPLDESLHDRIYLQKDTLNIMAGFSKSDTSKTACTIT